MLFYSLLILRELLPFREIHLNPLKSLLILLVDVLEIFLRIFILLNSLLGLYLSKLPLLSNLSHSLFHLLPLLVIPVAAQVHIE